jgi:DNA-binding response OmpR family regulator
LIFGRSVLKLLLIDDDINLARLLKQYLDGYQWQLQHSVLPSDAYRKISEYPPDAIILDIMLPEEDGFQVCRRSREQWDILRVSPASAFCLSPRQSVFPG